MALDQQLQENAQVTIYVASPSAAGRKGDRTIGSPSAISVYWEDVDQWIVLRDGTQAKSDAFFISNDAVAMGDYIWEPGADETDEKRARQPKRVDVLRDAEDGSIDHYEVYL